MIVLLIIVAVVVMVFLLIKLFCYLMCKRNDTFSKRSLDNNAIKSKELSSASPNYWSGNSIKVKTLSVIGDFTFFLFKICGYIPLHIIRRFLYKYVFGMKIGKKVVIYYGLETRCPWNITIGEGSIIGDHCILDARYGIIIGENVNISTGVWIWTLQHSVDSPLFGTEGNGASVIIENRAWISSRTNVLPGCIIREGSVLACGAVLTKSTQPYGIYAGIPAKFVKCRNKELSYKFDGEHRLFL